MVYADLIVNNPGQEVQDVLRLVCERLIDSYSSTQALVLIGSRAERESQKNSDLELKRIVPTTKKQIISGFLHLGRDDVVSGLKAAFITYREDREMNWEEGVVVAKTAMWLRARLRQRLKG